MAGIVLLAALGGILILQWAVWRRQRRLDRRQPLVAELTSLILTPNEHPAGLAVQFAGPLTNERLASLAPDPPADLDEADALGRVIGYRQEFRDPRSYGEITDVLLNATLRRGRLHRLFRVELEVFEDEIGARQLLEDASSPEEHVEGGDVVRVVVEPAEALPFATLLRWSRVDADGRTMQSKLEARWRAGQVVATVTTDSEPPHGLAADDLTRVATLLQARIDGNTLGQPTAGQSTAGQSAQAGG